MAGRNLVRVVGLTRLSASFRRRTTRTENAVREVVNETAERIFSESQRRVPVDTGNLKGSGRIEPTTGGEMIATVLYGGTAADYALAVHETHATKSKFLAEPANEGRARFIKDVREAVRRAGR